MSIYETADFPEVTPEQWKAANAEFLWRTAVDFGIRWERAKAVAWLRSEAATALWHDMDAFEPDRQEELETIVAVLEAYADALERTEHLK